MEEKDVKITKNELKKIMCDFFQDKPIMFAKFTNEEEWANDILEGKLYLNTFKYYRDLEKNSNKKGQGDINEGVLTLTPESLTIVSNTTGKKYNFKSNCMNIKYNDDDNILLYCMMSMTINDFDILEFTQNRNKVHVSMTSNFNKEKIEKMEKDFGKYVVIINPPAVIEKIISTSIKEEFPLEYGNVMYRHNNDLDRVKDFSNSSSKRFLYKDRFFEYQQEFRVAIQKKNLSDKYLRIGSLDGLAFAIKTEDLGGVGWETDLELYLK